MRRLTTPYEIDAPGTETETETETMDAADRGEAERAETPKQSFAEYVRSHFAAPPRAKEKRKDSSSLFIL